MGFDQDGQEDGGRENCIFAELGSSEIPNVAVGEVKKALHGVGRGKSEVSVTIDLTKGSGDFVLWLVQIHKQNTWIVRFPRFWRFIQFYHFMNKAVQGWDDSIFELVQNIHAKCSSSLIFRFWKMTHLHFTHPLINVIMMYNKCVLPDQVTFCKLGASVNIYKLS